MTISNDKTISLQTIMYEKKHVCPVCTTSFSIKTIETEKNQPLSIDADLYTRYSVINPIPYKVVLCNTCGYAAIDEKFDTLSKIHQTTLQKKVMPNYKKHTFSLYPSISDAIFKYRMALLCAILQKSKIGEQAYLALHLAWLYRDANDKNLEITFLERAANGFKLALELDAFPIFSIDQITATYLIAIISHRLGKPDISRDYLSRIKTDVAPEIIQSKINDLESLLI